MLKRLIAVLLVAGLIALGWPLGPDVRVILMAIAVGIDISIVVETLGAWRSLPSASAPGRGIRSVELAVSAYLPNEQGIIVGSLEGLLRSGEEAGRPRRICLVYRSPDVLPVERQLRAISASDNRLFAIRTDAPGGKAEQMNIAASALRAEWVQFLDADAQLVTLPTALEGVSEDADIVQGRNHVRNTAHFLGKIVAVEMTAKYLVSHYSRWRNLGVAYFCGSNAIWRRSTAQSVGFSSRTLVEDIESSVRAILNGHRIVFEPRLCASELAPINLQDWWHQRVRWATGWIQTGQLHAARLLGSSEIAPGSKAVWCYLFFLRRPLYSLVVATLLFSTVAALLRGEPVIVTLPLLAYWASLSSSGVLISITSWRQAQQFGEADLKVGWCLAYALIFPAYDALKCAVTLAAVVEAISRRPEWRVTPRAVTTRIEA